MDKLNLYQRIAKITAEIGTIKKEGTNTYHNYKYVTEAQLMEKLAELCIKHGVTIIPSVENVAQEENITHVSMSFRVFCTDDPQQEFISSFVGYGQDSQDKGPYKAMTGAYKYFLMKTFMVSSDDDPERDERPAQRPTQVKSNGTAGQRRVPNSLTYRIEGKCSKTGQTIGEIITNDRDWLVTISSDETKLALLSEHDQANIKLAARQLKQKEAA